MDFYQICRLKTESTPKQRLLNLGIEFFFLCLYPSFSPFFFYEYYLVIGGNNEGWTGSYRNARFKTNTLNVSTGQYLPFSAGLGLTVSCLMMSSLSFRRVCRRPMSCRSSGREVPFPGFSPESLSLFKIGSQSYRGFSIEKHESVCRAWPPRT